MWAKDGCKVDKTSVSETVAKCTHFSTFAVIMKVEKKVTRSTGHICIHGIGLEVNAGSIFKCKRLLLSVEDIEQRLINLLFYCFSRSFVLLFSIVLHQLCLLHST